MYTINSPPFRTAVAQLQSGSTRKRISKKNLCTIPLPVAPLPEQHRIVEAIESYLTRLNDAVASLERVQRNLERYRASVLKAAVEGRLVLTEAELAREEGRDYEPANVLLDRILKERKKRWIEDAAEKGRAKVEEKAKKAGKHWSQKDDTSMFEVERIKAEKKYKEPAAPDTDSLPELQEGWCWASIDQLAGHDPRSLTDGPFGSNLKTSHYTEYGPRVIRLQNIAEGFFNDVASHISENHYKNLAKHAVHTGDIIISSLGQDLPRACLVPDWLGPAIVKADCIRFAPDPGLGRTNYLMYALNSNPTRKRTEALIHGVSRPRIGLTLLRQLPLPLPPPGEQERISIEIARCFSIEKHLLVDIAEQVQRLDRLRQSILKWAFDGKLVDQDPRDESAAILLERIKAERKQTVTQKKA